MIIEDFLIPKFHHDDARGRFVKPFSKKFSGLTSFNVSEVFISVSKPNVLRGLHYQRRPYDQNKIVTVLQGEIIDLICCIDPNDSAYGKPVSTILSETDNKSILVPNGYAHGFLVIGSSNAVVSYITDSTHDTEFDTGIHWDSTLFDWPIDTPLVSTRDQDLPILGEHQW